MRFDLVGFLLVATFLGALEVVLDRGQEDDWFASNFIITFAAICALAFVLMIPWEITRRNPAVDLRMLASRQFGSCFLVMMATGAILLATTQFMPAAGAAGLRLYRDLGGPCALAGRPCHHGDDVRRRPLSGHVQPKYLIAVGAMIIALSMYDLTRLNGDVDFWFFALSRIYIGSACR